MAINDDYLNYIEDQLSTFGPVQRRKMFGGAGIYHQGTIFALVTSDNRLHFRVDDRNRGDFEAFGMGPFAPEGRHMIMPYYEVPEEILENRDQLALWASTAYDVAKSLKKK